MKNIFITMLSSFLLIFACNKDKVTKVSLPEGFIENDWEATLKGANDNNRQIVVHFYKPNCSLCKDFRENVLNNEEIETYSKNNFIGASINANEGSGLKLSADYNIGGTPGMAIINKDGTLKAKRLGKINATDFLNWVKENK